tara:strand:- start:34 stop:1374 length:1341 start_codon:yes stop_codon:yes gene_type:complete
MRGINKETIFALASGAGRAGVAIFRVSGPASLDVFQAVTGLKGPPTARKALRCKIADPTTFEVLDSGLALWFPGPASFTGEDVVEFHVHGGRAITEAVCGALEKFPDVRIAAPGEFSKRAFLAGKMDLTKVEALADLVEADTDMQRRQALRQFKGGLIKRLDVWREQLIKVLAYIEAWIDFPDEDLPQDALSGPFQQIDVLCAELQDFLANSKNGERLRDGLSVGIVGAPNVGKSSILNAIAEREVAIVSEKAGTTRDIIEVQLDLCGWPITLFDTAGLRMAREDSIEREGVRRALARAEDSDFLLVVFDCSCLPDKNSLALLTKVEKLVVWNKCDLPMREGVLPDNTEAIFVSARTGEGLNGLVQCLTEKAEEFLGGDSAVITRARHRVALVETLGALKRARLSPLDEILAEELRVAIREIGKISGRVDLEELLDVVFADFCIGK